MPHLWTWQQEYLKHQKAKLGKTISIKIQSGKRAYEPHDVEFTRCTTLCLQVRHCSTKSTMTSCLSPCRFIYNIKKKKAANKRIIVTTKETPLGDLQMNGKTQKKSEPQPYTISIRYYQCHQFNCLMHKNKSLIKHHKLKNIPPCSQDLWHSAFLQAHP